MRRYLFVLMLLALLVLAGNASAAGAETAVEGSSASSELHSVTQDYQLVRRVGMGLAVLGFLLGVSRVAMSEQPHQIAKAQHLLVSSLLVLIVLAGDRVIARGLAHWMDLSPSALPAFWQ